MHTYKDINLNSNKRKYNMTLDKESRAAKCKELIELVTQNKMSVDEALRTLLKQRCELKLERSMGHIPSDEPEDLEEITIDYFYQLIRLRDICPHQSNVLAERKEEEEEDKPQDYGTIDGLPIFDLSKRLKMRKIAAIVIRVLKMKNGENVNLKSNVVAVLVSAISGYGYKYVANNIGEYIHMDISKELKEVNGFLKRMNLNQL